MGGRRRFAGRCGWGADAVEWLGCGAFGGACRLRVGIRCGRASAAEARSVNANVQLDREAIAAFCGKWRIRELSLFGSALREDFGPESDMDFLVSFEPGARHTLFDMVHMQDELRVMFGRGVDLVSRRGIEKSRNYLRREEILKSAEVVYEA
ncbi:MAG: nucleotidyltransferase domain-containing protein [Phycisphaerae bacterium]|nr:nucleotidyltransferase domain-containing protein [Phycisphaerae bacterium]